MTTQDSNTLLISVETWYDGKRESVRVIDHNDRHDRVWLGKHCFWAFRNNRAITTYPMTGDCHFHFINER